jgi:hypothetical protein
MDQRARKLLTNDGTGRLRRTLLLALAIEERHTFVGELDR